MSQNDYEVEKIENVAQKTKSNINFEKPPGVLNILIEYSFHVKPSPFMDFVKANPSVLLEF